VSATRDDAHVSEQRQGPAAPLPQRLLARAVSVVVVRAPYVWPLLRKPTQRFWERVAPHWDERVRPASAEHLAPLAAACDRLDRAPDRVLELGTGTRCGRSTTPRR
jgi:hypothetical protein